MADYYTLFSTTLPIGSVANLAPALALYERLADELDAQDEVIGFAAEAAHGEGDGDAAALWLHDDAGDGNPEHVIAFALRCAEAFGLTGRWGFVWSLGCSRPRLDGFGGGAHVLDLGRRETVAWMDCEHWLMEQLAVRETPPARADALVQAAAAAQGWTVATQAGVLLDFIDGLVADDPGVADRLLAHLTAASAEAEEMVCRECGEPMFIAVEGTSHHAGNTMDGIDYARDRDHVAIAEGEIPPRQTGAAP
jgi:hypothetical protein